jgi:hypothetical protein
MAGPDPGPSRIRSRRVASLTSTHMLRRADVGSRQAARSSDQLLSTTTGRGPRVGVGPPTPDPTRTGQWLQTVVLTWDYLAPPRPHRLEPPTPKSLTCPVSVRLSHPSRTPTPCTAPGGPRYIGRRVVVGVPEEPGAVRSRGPTPSPAPDEAAQADGLVSVPGSAPCTPVRLTSGATSGGSSDSAGVAERLELATDRRGLAVVTSSKLSRAQLRLRGVLDRARARTDPARVGGSVGR